jgi:hypothetical protein
MRKTERQRFIRTVTELLLSLGAKQDDGEAYRFTIQTKAGVLRLHPDENHTSGPGTVFTRFDNPQAARQLVDCNRFSGKWNFHYFDPWDVETAIADLTFWLGKVILSPTNPATPVCSLERASK